MTRLKWQTNTDTVTFLELVFDFEAYAERSLPATPSSKLQGPLLPLHERARVLRFVMAMLRRHVSAGWLFPGRFIGHSDALIPLGCGLRNGLSARPYFSRPAVVATQLIALQQYAEQRCIQRLCHSPPSLSKRNICEWQPHRRKRAHDHDDHYAGRGGAARANTFAADYLPAVPMPTWQQRTKRSGGVHRHKLTRCADHGEPPCGRCRRRRRRGVRVCCFRGHHRCRVHSLSSCSSCLCTGVPSRLCCKYGHHCGGSTLQQRPAKRARTSRGNTARTAVSTGSNKANAPPCVSCRQYAGETAPFTRRTTRPCCNRIHLGKDT